MKKHLVTSAIIHTALIGTVFLYLSSPKKEQKQEKSIKIEVVALQEPKPIKEETPKPKEELKPREEPKKVEKQKQKPIPIPDVVDVKTQQPQENINVVAEAEPVVEKQSVIEPSVEQKVIEHKVSEPPKLSQTDIQNAKDAYLAQLRKIIEAKKVYPKNAKRLSQSGTVTIKFTILRNGTIKNMQVINTSSFKILDDAALKILEDIAKLEVFPKELIEDEIVVVLPIEYDLKQS